MERYEDAKKLLRDNRKKLDSIAEFLYKKETITGKEFMEIFHQDDEVSTIVDSENTPTA